MQHILVLCHLHRTVQVLVLVLGNWVLVLVLVLLWHGSKPRLLVSVPFTESTNAMKCRGCRLVHFTQIAALVIQRSYGFISRCRIYIYRLRVEDVALDQLNDY